MDRSLGNRIAIVQAMIDMTDKMPLDKLTVAAICHEAQVSKATFYRLFSSKYDVCQWVIGIYGRIGIDEIGRTLSWHEGIKRTTTGLDRHAQLLFAANETRHVFEMPKESSFSRRREILLETIRDYHCVEITPKIDFQVRAYARLSATIASEWHRGVYDYSEEEYVDYLVSIVPYDLFLLLNEPVHPEGSESFSRDEGKEACIAAKTLLDMIGDSRRYQGGGRSIPL